MDPLSVTASILTLITVAGSILQQLEHVRSRLDAQSELFTIMNTVTDLQATLIVVRDEYDALRKSTIPAARLAYETLPDTIQRLQNRLDELVDFAHANLLRNGKGLSHLGLSARRKKQLCDIRDNISDAHRNLQLVLLSANLRRNRDVLSRVEEAVIVQNQNYAETAASLSRITAQLTTLHDFQVSSTNTTKYRQDKIRSALAQSIYDDNAMSTQLRITTSMPRKACDRTCNCQCHVWTRFQTPKFLSAAVGTLFYSSTSTPSLDVRPCNVTTCLRSQPSSSSRLTYYFPSWMMRTAVISSMWTSLDGKNSSWFVKMPREISDNHICWLHILLWVERFRESLECREISPYDVGPTGVSLLHYSVKSFQFKVCYLLAAKGADWHFKDKSGISASDLAWRLILTSKNQDVVFHLRTLVGNEDSYDLCFGPLHRIVTGLSNGDLRMQIDLEPSRIDDRDWLGMTPLMWAAARGNLTHLNTLLSCNAQIEQKSSDDLNALHFAVKAESPECVRALLEAGADPNSVNCVYETLSKRQTPLDMAIDLGSYEDVLALLQYGANVNALDSSASPPICKAIYYGDDRIVQLLCEFGAVQFWDQPHHRVNNVLESAARFGTIKVMNVLSESAIAPIECSFATLARLFIHDSYVVNRFLDYQYRGNRHLVNHFVESRKHCSPEDRAAFIRLLYKKAILLDLTEGLDLSTELEKKEKEVHRRLDRVHRVQYDENEYEDDEDDDEYDEDEDEYDEDEDEYEYDEDEDEDEEDENQLDDVFEDALEDLSLLEQWDKCASPSAVAAS